MGDLLDRGAAFLDAQRHQHLSRPVVYRRGTDEKEVQTTIGKTEFEQVDDAGGIHRIESRDYLLRPADLVLGSLPTLPLIGDRIREQDGQRTYIYEVMAPGAEPPYRFSDPQRTTLRVHTKLIAVEGPG